MDSLKTLLKTHLMLFLVRIRHFFSILCILMVNSFLILSAQTADSLPVQSSDNDRSTRQTRIGWGLSYTLSDISPSALTLSFSAVGGRKISPTFELVTALHFNQSSSSNDIKGYNPVFQTQTTVFGIISQYRIAYSVSTDISLMVRPFAESETDWRNLRFGVGPSARVAGMLVASNLVNWDNGERIYSTQNTRQHNIGGHFVVEYSVPLAPSVEVALRGQMVRFAPSFFTIGDNISIARQWNFEQNIFHTLQFGAFLCISI